MVPLARVIKLSLVFTVEVLELFEEESFELLLELDESLDDGGTVGLAQRPLTNT